MGYGAGNRVTRPCGDLGSAAATFAPSHEQWQEVKNRLSLGAFSAGEIAALILGGTALVIILVVVWVLWFKARYVSLMELFSATVKKGSEKQLRKHYRLKFSVCCD
jgi:hypothetical protein